VAAGKTVRCAKCRELFQAPAMEDATAVSASPPARVPGKQPASAEVPTVAATDDDEVRRKKRKAKDRDADDEDRPRRRSKQDDDRDDKDHDEDDRDDDDRDEASIRRKPRRKQSRALGVTIALFVFGGFVLIVGCTGCGGLSYWIYTLVSVSPIVGTWESNNQFQAIKATVTFKDDGKGQVNVAAVQINFTYRFKGNQLEIDTEQGLFGGGAVRRTERYAVTIQGNDMTWTNIDNQPFVPREMKFRRVK
jgi:hypothetical protein